MCAYSGMCANSNKLLFRIAFTQYVLCTVNFMDLESNNFKMKSEREIRCIMKLGIL